MNQRYVIYGLAGILAVLMVVIVSASSGFGSEEAEVMADSRITIIDSTGREIMLDVPAEKVAYTHHSLSDCFKITGAWDQVVGRDANVDDEVLFPDLENKSVICSPMNPLDLNYEEIIKLHPDVLVLPHFDWYSGQDEIIEKLEPDIPVVFLDMLDPDPEIFCENIKKIGLITGNAGRAEEYCGFYMDVYDRIVSETSAVGPEERPNVFFKAIGRTSPGQITTYGKEMAWAESFFDAAGANNVAGELPIAYSDIDREWLIEQDIDAIVVKCWSDRYPEVFGYTVPDRERAFACAGEIRGSVMDMDVFSGSDAVRDGNVFLFHDCMDASQRNIVGLAYLAKWLYPEKFTDFDPEKVHREYLERFMDAGYDLNEGGIFGYPS